MPTSAAVCAVHKYHSPRPLRVVVHHIQPEAMGGPDTAANKVPVCDTGHYNIHRLLDDLIHNDGKFTTVYGGREERRLALLGYTLWLAAGKPGHPVFEIHFGGAT